MSTNQLIPFANGDTANVIDYNEWNALPARLTGFQSGIASSQQFNYILAQGGAAGYVLGQLVADYAGSDATIDAASLYAAYKTALANYVPNAVADGAISGAKITDASIAFAKLAAAAIASQAEAEAGTATDKLMTPQRVAQAISVQIPPAVPTGAIMAFGVTTIPDGWLLCNGANVSRTTYAALFSAIGTRFGAGDGSTTFTLPNLDGRFLQGTTDTSQVGKYVEAGLPNITGSASLQNNVGLTNEKGIVTGAFTAGSEFPDTISKVNGYGTSAIVFDASLADSTYGSAESVQPSSLQLMPCIKLRCTEGVVQQEVVLMKKIRKLTMIEKHHGKSSNH